MKKLIFIIIPVFTICGVHSFAQSIVKDKSTNYQEERMVYLQWDQNKFTPTSGFLSLNPYYWLVWGLTDPNYHKNDLRPLGPGGPQTQRLALVAAMNSTDNKVKLESDTLQNTHLSEIANQSGSITGLDPLWQLYYKKQLSPVINNSAASILAGLKPQVSSKIVSEGLFSWYKNELDMLRERINAAHNTDMDRGSRIMAYHRYLLEYRRLAAVWATRTSSAQVTLDMAAQQARLKNNTVSAPDWTPQSDVQIANKVLQHVQ